MNHRLITPLLAGCALLLCSCAATTSVKETWISPSLHEVPAGAVAILAVTDRGMVRTGLENRFAREIERAGQHAICTYEVLSLLDIKENHQAAAKLLRESGATTVMITRLVSSQQQGKTTWVGTERYSPVTTGFSPGLPYAGYGWGSYYALAFQDMSTVWGSQSKRLQLETSLFSLTDGEPLWSCITKTVFEDSSDYVAEMDLLADQIVIALRKDGLVK